MSDLTEFRVEIYGDREITGSDTTIFAMLPEWYVEVDGKRALWFNKFARSLKILAVSQAYDLGELLHHADFVITTDPAVVTARGINHDCDECRAGLAKALALLEEDPERELVVGQLYWASRRG